MARASANLFDFWQQEAELREILREQQDIDIAIAQNADELDFLMRALYFGGRREEFFSQLKRALNSAPALQWWKSSPLWLKKNFFFFLIDNLGDIDTDSRTLQFLIHLWDPDLTSLYRQLLSRLTLNQCRYLLAKTANGELRSLLKSREEEILSAQENRNYGLLNELDFLNYNLTFSSEKAELIKAALFQLEKTVHQHDSDAHDPQNIRALLDTVERVYQCGLILDAWCLLAQIYLAYHSLPSSAEPQLASRFSQRMSRLVGKTVSALVILKGELRLAEQAAQLCQQYFPDLEVDQRLYPMLRLYEAVLSSAGPAASLPWEILSCYEPVQQLFPEDSLPELRSLESLPGTGKKLLKLSHNLLASSPGEAFVLMELVRFLTGHSHILLSKEERELLLQDYIALWKWVPCRRFINTEITNQLAYGVQPPVRQEAERILNWSQPGITESLLSDVQKRPDLYRGGTDPIRNLALFGFLLGVLE